MLQPANQAPLKVSMIPVIVWPSMMVRLIVIRSALIKTTSKIIAPWWVRVIGSVEVFGHGLISRVRLRSVAKNIIKKLSAEKMPGCCCVDRFIPGSNRVRAPRLAGLPRVRHDKRWVLSNVVVEYAL